MQRQSAVSAAQKHSSIPMVGYSAWNGEDVGSSPACYTKFWAAMYQGWRKTFAMLLCRVQFPGGPQYSPFV